MIRTGERVAWALWPRPLYLLLVAAWRAIKQRRVEWSWFSGTLVIGATIDAASTASTTSGSMTVLQLASVN
jgi:hypothetical protein